MSQGCRARGEEKTAITEDRLGLTDKSTLCSSCSTGRYFQTSLHVRLLSLTSHAISLHVTGCYCLQLPVTSDGQLMQVRWLDLNEEEVSLSTP
eukprot:COSAG05_NODE_376_length_10629_cov_43.288319_11_plen_93_part_00